MYEGGHDRRSISKISFHHIRHYSNHTQTRRVKRLYPVVENLYRKRDLRIEKLYSCDSPSRLLLNLSHEFNPRMAQSTLALVRRRAHHRLNGSFAFDPIESHVWHQLLFSPRLRSDNSKQP